VEQQYTGSSATGRKIFESDFRKNRAQPADDLVDGLRSATAAAPESAIRRCFSCEHRYRTGAFESRAAAAGCTLRMQLHGSQHSNDLYVHDARQIRQRMHRIGEVAGSWPARRVRIRTLLAKISIIANPAAQAADAPIRVAVEESSLAVYGEPPGGP